MKKNHAQGHGRRSLAVVASALALVLTATGFGASRADSESGALSSLDASNPAAFLQVGGEVGGDAESESADRGPRRRVSPAESWKQAARLQNELSQEEKDRLLERGRLRLRAFGSGMRAGRGRPGGLDGPGGAKEFARRGSGRQALGSRNQRAAGGADLDRLNLTPDQRGEVRAIHASHAEELVAIQESMRKGETSLEDGRAQRDALRATVLSDVSEILTPEQQEVHSRLEAERQARRERLSAERNLRKSENRKAMQETLGLSDEQADDVDQLVADHRDVLRDFQRQMRNETNAEARREAAKEFGNAEREKLASVLDEQQLETFLIHGALVARRAGVAVAARRAGAPYGRGFDRPAMDDRGRMGFRSNMDLRNR